MHKKLHLVSALSCVLFSPISHAIVNQCENTDVTVKSITQIVGGNYTYDGHINASVCVGANEGNVQPLPQFNLGLKGDGLLNGAVQKNGFAFDPGAFITEDDLQSIGYFDENKIFHSGGPTDDPGWIYVGKDEGSGFNAVDTVGGVSDVVRDDIFRLECDDDCFSSKMGRWYFTPDEDIIQRLTGLTGPYDQFAIAFKAGNQYAIYDFKMTDLGPLDKYSVYHFSGTYDIKNALNNKNLSNVTLWARDPIENTSVTVSEPEILFLFGLVMFVLIMRRRHVINTKKI